MADFKKHLNSMIDYFYEITQQILERNLAYELHFQTDLFDKKVDDAKKSFSSIENIVEGLAMGLTKQLNETHTQNLQMERDRDELSKSLQQIDLTYQKNKKKLERDLNKMEFKVKQVQDTREKMQLRHIKGLDIVQNEVNRIMPNNLTEKWLPGTLLEDEENEAKNTEQIRKDLEEVDDVFAAANVAHMFGGAGGGIGIDAKNIDGQQNDNPEGNV